MIAGGRAPGHGLDWLRNRGARGKRAEIAPPDDPPPGADPPNLCGNAREGRRWTSQGLPLEPARSPHPRPPVRDRRSAARARHRFGDLETLAGLDLEVAAGEVVAIVGPSGCGKSTLLELVGGLREPGGGRDRGRRRRDARGERLGGCAWMPQRDLLLPWLRAIDNAALALRIGGASARGGARAARAPLLERLGLGGFERSYPGELSGGMRQRVAFARTLLAGKPVLLLDEPFASLDAITRADLQEWLRGELARGAPDDAARDPRRRGGAVPRRPRAGALARPGRVVWRAASPARSGADAAPRRQRAPTSSPPASGRSRRSAGRRR